MITVDEVAFRFLPALREKILELLGGDESKLIILEDELSPEQRFVRNTGEIGPYGHTLREGQYRRQTAEDITGERRENRKVLAQVSKLKKIMAETRQVAMEWSWYNKVAEHREQHPDEGHNLLDGALSCLERDIALLEGRIRHYSGKEKDLREQEEKRHIIAVVVSLFPGRINVEGYRVIDKHRITTDPYRLTEKVMEELGIKPGDFRRIYTEQVKRLNKIRNM